MKVMERYKKLFELSVVTNKHEMYSKLFNQELEKAGKAVMSESGFKRHMNRAFGYFNKCLETQLKIIELQSWFLEKYGIKG